MRLPYPNPGTPDDVDPSNFSTWRDGTFVPDVLNRPYDPQTHSQIADNSTTPPDKAYWELAPNSGGLPNVIPVGQVLVIYFEAHLSRTFVWSNGLEGQYAINATTAAQGGDRYSTWTTELDGSGSTNGSSPHFNVDITAAGWPSGAITLPIPIPPQPPGLIDGYKFNDLNANHLWDAGEPPIQGWDIHIYSETEGIVFNTHYTTDVNGFYSIPALTSGIWYLGEHVGPGDPATSGWTQSYPSSVVNIAPSAVSSLISSFPSAIQAAIGAAHLAAWGWIVTLDVETNPQQHNVNFGNFNTGCLTVTKSVVQDVVNPAALDGSFVIHVVGPSYPAGTDLTFTLTDGAITGTNPQTLNNLIPGNYTLTEPTLPAGWSNTSGLGVVAVSAGATCATATVVNTFADGCLTVTKSVVQDVVNPAALDGSFVIHVVGPSYPAGTDLTFTLTDGAITGTNPQTLNNLIPGDYTLTEPTLPAGWSNTSGLGVVAVSAGETCATATVVNTFADGCLTITKVVDYDSYKFPLTLDGTFSIKVVGPSYPGPTGTTLTFTMTDGAIVGGAQTLDNLIPGTYAVSELSPAPAGAWIVTGEGNVSVSAGTTCATKTITNTLRIPETTIFLGADVFETTPGGNVWLHISDTNTGDQPLSDPHIHLYIGGVEFDADTVTPGIQPLMKGDAWWATSGWVVSSGTANGDTNDNGIMDIGETWYWAVQVTIYSDTTFLVNGHGTDLFLNPVDGPTYSTETSSILIEVGGATRTWGFWKTHLYLVEWMFSDAAGSPNIQSINLGTWPGSPDPRVIDTICKYMGLMWSDQSKNSDGSPRTQIDAARVHTAHQALAAIMNYYMPGGAPLPAGITLQSIADILSSNNIKDIRNLGSALAAYNESGDDVALDPIMPPTGRDNNADPQGARAVGAACEVYWNTPPDTKGKK
ncbi:MAG: hypothetical protein TUN42_00830 [Dehalogenimonas sp.]